MVKKELSKEEIIKTVTVILNEIIKVNTKSLREGDFMVRPGFGYDKYYLNQINGSYNMSLQGLIHYILFEKKLYVKILNKNQYTSLLKTIKEDPESIYDPGDEMDADYKVQELLDAVYSKSIAYVGRSLGELDIDIKSTFSDFLDIEQTPLNDLKIEPESGSYIDPRDNLVYRTVTIGKQNWLAENLDAHSFRNGDPIAEAKSDEEWKMAGDEGSPVWCYYRYDWRFFFKGRFYGMKLPLDIKRFGKLYNWFAITDKRGLAPDGWKVPNNTDWNELINMLGEKKIAGKSMKTVKGWQKSGNGTNESGFSALPGGERFQGGRFCYAGRNSSWWTSTGKDSNAWTIILSFGFQGVNKHLTDKQSGFYVRCLRYS